MKVWSRVMIKDKNREVEVIAKALTNYLYTYGPIVEITKKYHIDDTDRRLLDQYTANRVAGLLLLYLSKDYGRINDIANKYNIDMAFVQEVIPELEGYVDKEKKDF